MTQKETATIILDGKSFEFPIVTGSMGEQGIDISTLRQKTGFITLDNGYGNTGACKSAITYLDGLKGVLSHRGHSIEELAGNYTFVEVAYLLFSGHFPDEPTLEKFQDLIKAHTQLPERIRTIIEQYPEDAHPMALLSSCTVAMSALYPSLFIHKEDDHLITVIARLMGHFSAIAACTYRKIKNKPFIDPDPELDYCENFLYMMFGKETYDKDTLKVLSNALNKLLILHADHEQNCSTSTVRLVSSSRANIYASLGAAISALWGPLHGGANQKVMEMLNDILADGGDIEKTLARAKDKNDPFRLMGFGHRVYKTYDPRARIAKAACHEYLRKLDKKEHLVEIAMSLERAALSDPYFQDRHLFPNVDFYTGIVYRAMGIPTDMFTVLFALGRLPGWIAHVIEMRNDPDTRIGRPRQIYTGEVPEIQE